MLELPRISEDRSTRKLVPSTPRQERINYLNSLLSSAVLLDGRIRAQPRERGSVCKKIPSRVP